MKNLIIKVTYLSLFGLVLFLVSCSQNHITNEDDLKNNESVQLRTNPCMSNANDNLLNYTPGSIELNTISFTDPNTGLLSFRKFGIYVPTTYDSLEYYPLVYMFHGKGGSAQNMVTKTTWRELSEAHGLIVAYPQALVHTFSNGTTAKVWNTINAANNAPVGVVFEDDVFFFREMNTFIGDNLPIYCDSIYTCGFSNGNNFNKQRLRVEASDIIAALCGAGTIGESTGVNLPFNSIHRPYFEVCGTKDDVAIDYCVTVGNAITELPLDSAIIDTTFCMIDKMDSLRLGMELDTIRTVTEGVHINGRLYTEYLYDVSTVGQTDVEYKFRVVENLKHKVPSSNNNFHPDYIEKYWTWLRQFCL